MIQWTVPVGFVMFFLGGFVGLPLVARKQQAALSEFTVEFSNLINKLNSQYRTVGLVFNSNVGAMNQMNQISVGRHRTLFFPSMTISPSVGAIGSMAPGGVAMGIPTASAVPFNPASLDQRPSGGEGVAYAVQAPLTAPAPFLPPTQYNPSGYNPAAPINF